MFYQIINLSVPAAQALFINTVHVPQRACETGAHTADGREHQHAHVRVP